MDTRVSLIVLAIVFEMVAILTDLFSDGSEYRKSIIRKTWIICIGCVAGGFVGYLIGTSSLLTFGDVFGRGASFQGVQLLLRPAAEKANNYMFAGSTVGVVAGIMFASLRASGLQREQQH
jgi:hypothetical protein